MTAAGTEEPKQRPIHVERVGWIQASVWERKGRRGVYHEVSLRRGYPGSDGRTKYSGAFHLRDLTDLKLVIDRAADAVRARSPGSGPVDPGSSSGGPLEGPLPDEPDRPGGPPTSWTSQHT